MIALATRLRADGWTVAPAAPGVRLHAVRGTARLTCFCVAGRAWCDGGPRDDAPAVQAAGFAWRAMLRALFPTLPARPPHPLMPAAARAARWPGY